MLRLSSGSWSAEVYPEFGMNLASLNWEGKEIFCRPKNITALQDEPFLYGNPLLFPANRTKHGDFSFQGKLYALPINDPAGRNNLHGGLFSAPFSVLSYGADHICARFRNRGEKYPFSFDITITDRLTQKGWYREVELLALEDMPFTLAFHSTFLAPKSFSVPVGRRFLRDENYLPTGKTAPATAFKSKISDFYEAAHHTATLDEYAFTVSKNFNRWMVFNGGGKDFLCVEPQCGDINGLNTNGHRLLKAGGQEIFTLQIEKITDGGSL